ncbi:hypothetical protein Vau01_100140 [Virgisporangium aurantiacum]|uniref:Uncharacterized protein n=1 Tax=Virgisporangium aurantiacum TaxID=175570 RepID=A0A8J3ZJB3_9ACTN|nr:hypothetical protein Vau01_100140 [Virgisporangium aurantiacum]
MYDGVGRTEDHHVAAPQAAAVAAPDEHAVTVAQGRFHAAALHRDDDQPSPYVDDGGRDTDESGHGGVAGKVSAAPAGVAHVAAPTEPADQWNQKKYHPFGTPPPPQ